MKMATNDTNGSKPMSPPSQLQLAGYQFHNLIGIGAYATVYKASALTKNGSEICAIKVIDRSKLVKHKIDNLINEIGILKPIRHPHIVKMIDFQYDANDKRMAFIGGETLTGGSTSSKHEKHGGPTILGGLRTTSNVYIIMEHCDLDLSVFLRKRQHLPESICVKFLKQLAKGLHYLRSNNISHFDLKPKNLLLKMKPTVTLKIADFGFAEYVSDEVKVCVMKGSPLYMAPEMLQQLPCDAKVDLWSVGIIFYECLFGEPPFAAKGVADLTTDTVIKIPESDLSWNAHSLLSGLLQCNPQSRMDFDVFFAHPLICIAHAQATARTYAHGVQLAAEAVRCDRDRQLDRAHHLYCDALTYLIPHYKTEPDPERKSRMRARLEEYMRRAEQLGPPSNKSVVRSSSSSLSSSVATSSPLTISLSTSTTSATPLDTLLMMFKSSPVVYDALETMATGEMYLAEEDFGVAHEKFEYGLSVLIDALAKEPPGQRRNALHSCVQTWLDRATWLGSLLDVSDKMAAPQPDSIRSEDLAGICSLQ